MGMPDMFRTDGVGAWIFLAVSDGAMVFGIIWFGYHIRNKVKSRGFKDVSGFLAGIYGSRLPGYLFFISAYLFLVPYAAIQIRGFSIFFSATFQGALPEWAWALIIVGIMLLYAEIGCGHHGPSSEPFTSSAISRMAGRSAKGPGTYVH